VEDRCAECGYDGRGLTIADIAGELERVPARVRTIRDRIADDALRARPATGGWAPIEYIGHLRDLMAFHRWVIERALAEDEPAIGPADPDAAVAEAGYVGATPDDLLDQLDRRVHRLVALLASLDDAQTARLLTLDGDDGPSDVGLVARNALHEGHHHVLDLERLSPSTS
jgi:hypothetical protein